MAPNSVKLLYPMINNAKGYIKKSNGNKYLTLVRTDESRDMLENYGKIWSKIRDLITSISIKSDLIQMVRFHRTNH